MGVPIKKTNKFKWLRQRLGIGAPNADAPCTER